MSRVLRMTFWQWVFFILMAAGAYATYMRIVHGLGGSTNLNDQFPWGLWIGFDVLCGVALAGGGFTLAATVHVFNIERYKPVARAAILTAFLGYLLVIVALMFDLGRPYRIWHPLVMWNTRSVMFEVGWCVTLYTTVLALEFLPVILERFGLRKPLRWMHSVTIPLVITGCILSTLHQSSLGSVYLIVPHKLHPLWYSPLLPVFFFVSAVSVGLAMTIFESWHSSREFGRQLEMPLLTGLARVLAVVLLFYLVLRFMDLAGRGALRRALEPTMESYLFALEMFLTLAPALLLFRQRIRTTPSWLYACAVMVIFSVVANRLNVSITGMESASGVRYMPRLTEVAVTLAMVAFGFFVFRLAVKYLPVFEPAEAGARPAGEAAGGARWEPAAAKGD